MQNQKDLQKSDTQDQTSTKSHGIKKTEKICPNHGKYTSKGMVVMGDEDHVIWTACPQCQAEREQKEIDRQERNQNFTHKARLEKSGVPLRFKEKRILDLKYTSGPQVKILKTIKNYLKAILNGACSSLIMCGKPGTGKTHIGCALIKETIENDKDGRIVTTANLMRQVKQTYQKDSDQTEDEIYQFYGSLPLLVIDEVGVQFGSETEKLIFYEVINQRYNNMLPTVLISNLTADELSGFIGERAFDRFKEDGGAILAFDWESYRK